MINKIRPKWRIFLFQILKKLRKIRITLLPDPVLHSAKHLHLREVLMLSFI